uniref:Uncharacterized protein n=1 Tax=viral metagenome TaxID=1070528 RepID=A0A6C0KE97_9ZZZZ
MDALEEYLYDVYRLPTDIWRKIEIYRPSHPVKKMLADYFVPTTLDSALEYARSLMKIQSDNLVDDIMIRQKPDDTFEYMYTTMYTATNKLWWHTGRCDRHSKLDHVNGFDDIETLPSYEYNNVMQYIGADNQDWLDLHETRVSSLWGIEEFEFFTHTSPASRAIISMYIPLEIICLEIDDANAHNTMVKKIGRIIGELQGFQNTYCFLNEYFLRKILKTRTASYEIINI